MGSAGNATGGELSRELVDDHDVVVFTNGTHAELLRWNDHCRNRVVLKPLPRGEVERVPAPVKFIAVGSYGAAGFVFSDFGPGFVCKDESGEPPHKLFISGISNEANGVVTFVDEGGGLNWQHRLPESQHDGYLTFHEVEGMYAKDERTVEEIGLRINLSGPWKVKHNKKTVQQRGVDGSERVCWHVALADPRVAISTFE